jgi:hypothetical protein
MKPEFSMPARERKRLFLEFIGNIDGFGVYRHRAKPRNSKQRRQESRRQSRRALCSYSKHL